MFLLYQSARREEKQIQNFQLYPPTTSHDTIGECFSYGNKMEMFRIEKFHIIV